MEEEKLLLWQQCDNKKEGKNDCVCYFVGWNDSDMHWQLNSSTYIGEAERDFVMLRKNLIGKSL